MKKIKNPYVGLKGYNCFGCSPDNPDGLQMKFIEDGNYVISHWIPKPNFNGYDDILHGGIQATLMDEIASWCIQVKLKTSGVTTRLNTQFKKPVSVSQGAIILKAHIVDTNRRIARVNVELFNAGGELCSTGDISYFIFPEDVARKRLNFPEYSSFFE